MENNDVFKIHPFRGAEGFDPEKHKYIDFDEGWDEGRKADEEYMHYMEWYNTLLRLGNTTKDKYFNTTVQKIDISKLNLEGKRDITGIFSYFQGIDEIDVSNLDTSNVEKMLGLFCSCKNLKTIDVSKWDTSIVYNMREMFFGCESLEEIDVSHWDTARLVDAQEMFAECKNLKKIDVSNWDTSSLADITSMFAGCDSLRFLDLSKWDSSEFQKYMTDAFNVNGIIEIKLGEKSWDISHLYYHTTDHNEENKVIFYVPDAHYETALNKREKQKERGNIEIRKVSELENNDVFTYDLKTGAFGFNPEKHKFVNISENWEKVSKKMRLYYPDQIEEYDKQKDYYNDDIETLDISRMDTKGVSELSGLFMPFRNIKSINSEKLDISGAKHINCLFFGCKELKQIDTSTWDTSNVREMSYLFSECEALEKIDLSHWNTEHVISCDNLFSRCKNLKEVNVNGWDMQEVSYMRYMFAYCKSLRFIDLSSWDTREVEQFESMFEGCVDLKVKLGPNSLNLAYDYYNYCYPNMPDSPITFYVPTDYFDIVTGKMDDGNTKLIIKSWSDLNDKKIIPFVYTVTETNLDHMMLPEWDISKARNLDKMFENCHNLEKIPVENWDVSNITSMVRTFANCKNLRKLNPSKWNTSNLKAISEMFRNDSLLAEVNVSTWDTSNVIVADEAFSTCTSLEEIPVDNWDTGKMVNMDSMFLECKKLKKLNVSNWNTGSAKVMSYLFAFCCSLPSIDVSNWNTSSVEDMKGMFWRAEKVKELDVSKWNTSNVKDMSYAFSCCYELETIPLENWDVSNVDNMESLFSFCRNLQYIDLSKWDIKRSCNLEAMFHKVKGCIVKLGAKSLRVIERLGDEDLKDSMILVPLECFGEAIEIIRDEKRREDIHVSVDEEAPKVSTGKEKETMGDNEKENEVFERALLYALYNFKEESQIIDYLEFIKPGASKYIVNNLAAGIQKKINTPFDGEINKVSICNEQLFHDIIEILSGIKDILFGKYSLIKINKVISNEGVTVEIKHMLERKEEKETVASILEQVQTYKEKGYYENKTSFTALLREILDPEN